MTNGDLINFERLIKPLLFNHGQRDFDLKDEKEAKLGGFIDDSIFIDNKPRENINTIHSMSMMFLRERQSITIVLCKTADDQKHCLPAFY